MKIAIFGGAFDPPHLGHLFVAQQTLDYLPIEEIWFMPDYSHPWNKQMTAPQKRLAMVSLMANQKIKASDFAISIPKISYTFEIVEKLKASFNHQFFFLIGSEHLEVFSKWHRADELPKKIDFLVFPRPDHPISYLPAGFSKIDSPDLVVTNLSSTIIKERIKKGLSIKEMVTEGVGEYIKRHGLYLHCHPDPDRVGRRIPHGNTERQGSAGRQVVSLN